MKRLIVNADDFGLTPGVNRAIIEAHTRGIVTSATLMANMPAFAEAVQLAKSHPTLGVGLHFNITQGAPVAPTTQVRSLLGGNGEFLGTSTKLARRALLGQLREEEIGIELRAQLERLRSAGLAVTHVDSHKHAHALPGVLRAIQQIIPAFGICALRLPRERARWARAFRSPKQFKQSLTATGLRWLCPRVPHGLLTTTAFFGVMQTGFWGKGWLLDLLAHLPEGSSELMCHPGYDDAALGQVQTRLRATRAVELQLLTDPEIRAAIHAHGIELIHFGYLKRLAEVAQPV